VTVSIGICSLSSPDDTANALIKRADRALYLAKRDGRNRVVAAAA
jgi:two-component system, cell cycle response regulator